MSDIVTTTDAPVAANSFFAGFAVSPTSQTDLLGAVQSATTAAETATNAADAAAASATALSNLVTQVGGITATSLASIESARSTAIGELNTIVETGPFQPTLGFTPVQQGTGIGQLANQVKIGWSSEAALKATVDTVDLGHFAMQPWVTSAVSAAARAAIFAPVTLAGLKCDGTTDDAPALQALVNATSGDILLAFPMGTTFLGSTITIPGSQNVTIRGAAMRGSRLLWASGVSIGINHGQGSPGTGTFHIRDITLLPTTSGGTALRTSQHWATNPTACGFACDSVQIGNVGSGAVWNRGIDMYGAWNSGISNTYLFMDNPETATNSVAVGYSPSEVSTGLGNVTTALACDNLFIQGGAYGLKMSGAIQGVNVINSNFTAQQYGIYWEAAIGDAAGTMQIMNNQITSAVRGIYVENAGNPIIQGNYFIQFDSNNPVWHYSAIELSNSGYFAIDKNYVLNPGGTIQSPLACILVRNVLNTGFTPSRINGNTLAINSTSPVELRGTVLGCSVCDNDFWNHDPGNPANGRVVQTPAPAWTATTTYPPNSAVTNNGITWISSSGGVSGSSGPMGGFTASDGGITWSNLGPSLATYPNPCINKFYGSAPIIQDGAGNLILTGFITGSQGLRLGSSGQGALIDLKSGAGGSTYDARIYPTGGTPGSDGNGHLFIAAGGGITFSTPQMGFFGATPVSIPTVSGSWSDPETGRGLTAALAAMGLLIDHTGA